METVMDVINHAPDVLLIAVSVVGLGLGLALVRYMRADRATRASIRQAMRVRRGWIRLARMAGLTVTDKTPGWLADLTAPKGTTAPRVLVPKIKVRADRFGVIVRAKCLPKVGLEEFQRSARFLADAWRCTRVSVTPDGPGRVVIRGVRTDPLVMATEHHPNGAVPADLSRWSLGVDEYATEVMVSLANVPGVTVAGVPGAGKTSMINKLVCDLAPSPAVQFAVADGKVSAASEGDYADVHERLFAFVGDDLDDANALFKRLVALRRARSSVIRNVLGVKNMWHVGPSEVWPLTVLIIDEAHTYFREYKGSDQETKRLAALTAENARLVEDLVKKGRSVGFLVLIVSQKVTGDAIPTFIRDVCPVGLSFAQKTVEAAVAALGDDIRNWPDASPVTLQDPAYTGVAVMAMQGRPGFARIRTPYVDDTDAARIAITTAHLAIDPALFLDTSDPELWADLPDDDGTTVVSIARR
ncbi:FtsK/SpoIIIE domain-containing protein [Streptomyces sp. MUM 2J]|uniref:FtsK/SpoIIIE domain-containing protein n=1 Tax=Streptomyces sp. MUM 2J TaxID=2791987 RepID=UPI001F03D784|nr:FtsK/SpoIIIE domain-containing protein [Streptomyces sp. MUM 2J]MCH0563606.1 cell division protein FtsK [Streptomyces sp. MUM 2J]